MEVIRGLSLLYVQIFINIDFDKILSAYFNLGMLLLAVLVSLQVHVCICIADVTENFLVLN